jgi:hypothetical protein
MRLLHAVVFAVFAALQLAPAQAQDQWREFKSDADGFSVQMPATPTISARRIGTGEATQTTFVIDQGPVAYLVSLIQLEKGKVPAKPDQAYYQNLMKNYADGSKTKIRTTRMATLAGKPAMEGIADDGDAAHVVYLTAAGDKVWMVVYVGKKGQENGADATLFRTTFKLL